MNDSFQQREAARSAFLEQLCRQIEQWRVAGATLSQAIRKARNFRRVRLFKHGRLSRGSLIRLYYAWRENRTPAVFVRNYKAGGFKPRIPLALIEEFLNRLTADRVVSAKAVMQSLRSDWKLGRSIPGLGTWPEYWQRLHGEAALRTVPPAFPVSVTTLYSYLSSSTPGAYQKRIASALRAQSELNRFFNFIENQRATITARRGHELLGYVSPQPTTPIKIPQ